MAKARQQYFADETSIAKDSREFAITPELLEKINSIEPGAQVNVIETVKVNGEALTPDENKAVDIDVPLVDDTLYSTSSEDALSARQGRILYDYIQNIQSRGRFLSNWNCVTGLAMTNPADNPYTYRSGDYYLVSNVAALGGTNYKPDGSQYIINQASTTVESQTVKVGDMYIYDGTYWILLVNTEREIAVDSSLSTTSTNPVENRVVTNALNGKQDTISDLAAIRAGAALGDTALQPGDSLSQLTGTADDITEGSTNLFMTTAERSKLSNQSGVNTGDETQTTIKNKLGQASTSTDGYLTSTDWNTFNGKQDAISDLATIRSNASDGKSASDTIATYGDIVTHDVSEFATSAQGALADTAIQPLDNVSELTNDAGYVTSAYHDATKQDVLVAGNNIQIAADGVTISATDTTYVASDFDIKDLSDSTGLRTEWSGKQDELIAGTNIQIASDGKTISATDTTYTAGVNVSISNNNVISATDSKAEWGNITGTLTDQTDLNTALGGKQDTLIAGTNVQIAADGKTISATDTTYTAGSGIAIDANNVISNTQTSAEWGNIQGDIADQTDLQTQFGTKQDTLIAGTNIQIAADGKTISATDTTYQPTDFDIKDLADSTNLRTTWSGKQNTIVAGTNVQIAADGVTISATDTTYTASDFDIKDLTDSTNLRTTWSGKQDELIAGTNIQIAADGKTISATDTTYTATDFDIKDLTDSTGLRTTWSGKQDAISDLATIRTGAGKGATAVQPLDNVSTLTNDTGYITKSVNDLTNYYTKSETYTKSEVADLVANFAGFKVVATLPTTDIKTNIIYLLGPVGSGADKYEEYIYSNNSWVMIGETSVDLTNYFNTSTQTSDAITQGSTNLFLTSAERTKLGNTSGTNTGDETKTTIQTKLGAASSSTSGYLTSTDWSTFNGKANASDVNTRTFYIASTSDTDGMQRVINYLDTGKNPIVDYGDAKYTLYAIRQEGANLVFYFYALSNDTGSGTKDNLQQSILIITKSSGGAYSMTTSNFVLKDTFLSKTNTTSYTPTGNYNPATKKYVDDRDTYIGTSAPSNPTEGQLWYDTTNDVLKSYNGSSWDVVGSDASDITIKAFYIDGTNDLTVFQAAYDRYKSWKTPVIIDTNNNSTYVLDRVSGNDLIFKGMWTLGKGNSYSNYYGEKYTVTHDSSDVVTSVAYGTTEDFKFLDTTQTYSTPFVPTEDGHPATKKYVDDNISAATQGAVSDEAYAASWNGVTGIAPSKNALYDKISAMDTTISGKQDALSTQTAYTTKGTATKVPTITTNTLGQVTGITETDITFPVTSVNGSTGAVTGLQTTSNLKTSLSDNSDSYYPSQKAVKTAVDGKQDALSTQTAYTSKGTATKVPQITTNSLGQVTGITEVDIEAGETYTAGEGIEIKNGPDYSAMQGPAPAGFHVPLNTEWQAVYDIWTALGGGSSDGTNFGIALKLPFAGNRNYSSAGVKYQGSSGNYWSSSRNNTNNAYYLVFLSTALNPQTANYRAFGLSVRCFKDSPVVPTSNWTKLYGTSIESGGIFWSNTDGLISLSSDGITWITIADKNLGATTVWNSGDTLSETNCGKYYQWGNNYGFPRTGSVTTSSTQVDASNYGPGNYYSSNTFIKYNGRWDTTDNGNLWGGVTGVVSLDNAITNTGVLSVNGQTGNVTIASPDMSNYLAKDNTTAFTPTGNYNPSTKKYVDDNKVTVVDNVTSTSTTSALSANQGKVLKGLIDDLSTLGKFLSLWNSATGQPISFPLDTPYTYSTGDYFMVETLPSSGSKYMPNGSSYTGTASSTVDSTNEVEVGDFYIYDGSVWLYASNHGKEVSFSNISGQPSDNTALNTALSGKADASDVLTKTNTTSFTPSGDYQPATKKYVDDGDTKISSTAPSSATEGMLWYDTTNDVLKSYNGTSWDEAGTHMVVLSYGSSTWQDFLDAYNKNAIVYCRASSNSNPGTGTQGRMAFMAFVTFSGTTPTSVEFQYYRSRSDHNSAANQLDQVFVYTLSSNNGGTWSVVERNTAAKAVAGTGIGLTFGSGNMTISADAQYDDTAYAASWNGVTDKAPTKNAVYDKISAMDTTISGKQDALTTQTAYTAVGSSHSVPQITTNSLGQVTGITEVEIGYPQQISDAAYSSSWNGVTSTAPTQNAVYDKISAMDTTIAGKQATLVSGTNIKTINGNSLLGSGNISVGGISNNTTGTTTTVTQIWAGTESEYSNLSSKNATTIYFTY